MNKGRIVHLDEKSSKYQAFYYIFARNRTNRRNKMETMKASLWMERFGHGIVNAFLLASLPAAAIAILLQGY